MPESIFDRRFVAVCQVRSGPFGHTEGGGSMSHGAGTLDDFLHAHKSRMAHGAVIVDGRAVEMVDAIVESMRGPIPSATRLYDEGEGPLQYVTWTTKARRWKAIGARIGTWDIQRGAVAWEAA